MGQFFSDKVEEAIHLIWHTFVPSDMQRGFSLLKEAAEGGDADAMCFLARCYLGGDYVWAGGGLPHDEELASRWIKESVLHGSAAGVLCAMRCGELTPSVRRDMPYTTKEARDIILKKAEAGHPFCQYMIGNTYYWGDIIEMDSLDFEEEPAAREIGRREIYLAAAAWFERALKNGFSIACRNLTRIYADGEAGIPKDPGKVLYYTRLAAGYGDPEMMNNCGCLLTEAGKEEEGFHWYKQSADAGEPVGCYNAGWCYEYGQGTEQNRKKAFSYYKQSAEKGYAEAYFKMGFFHYLGEEVEEDNAKAVYWLQKGADEDIYWCYPALASCYQNGWGTPQDYDTAFYLFTLSEKHIDQYDGDTQSIVWDGLGNAYGYGEGVDEDFKRAVSYYRAAAELGNENAVESLTHFKKNLLGRWKRIDN